MKKIIDRIKLLPAFRRLVVFLNSNFPVFVAKYRQKMYFNKRFDVNNPEDLNEKILWLSLFTDTSEWTRLTDKYAVREYVKECGLENILIPLYGRWDNPHDIDWEKLPQSFVLKSNNGASASTIKIVKDKNTLDIPKLTVEMETWLTHEIGIYTTEFHYMGIKPCIIAEQLLENDTETQEYTSTLIDYKIWCFNGKAYAIWTCMNRNLDGAEVATFDKDWNYHPEGSIFNKDYKKQPHLCPKPICLKEMLDAAEKLSKPFPVVRVDLYCVGGKVYFGELTFTSNGGTNDFYTNEYLLEMGQQIDLSGVKKDRVNKPSMFRKKR